MKTVRISVRNLVEFILRNGDIDDRAKHGPQTGAMLEGARIHRAIQGAQGSDYSAEVSLKESIELSEDLTLTVEGRADGIIDRDGEITIDEIKGMYIDVDKLEKPYDIHLSQAKCYAAIKACQDGLDTIGIRMTYVGINNGHIRYFNSQYDTSELTEWFTQLVNEYKRWAEFMCHWEDTRNTSIRSADFPYEYRPGQKDLSAGVYRTIYHGKKLFLEAPTGTGKTLATVYPGIKALGEGLVTNIFFLTAKNIGANAANDAFKLLRDVSGLSFKSVTITGREKACINTETVCDPEHCPYAKGHYDRINDVLYEILTGEDVFSRETIEEYARKGQVCPYALARDLAMFSDGVVCDYNYVFDPSVALGHFFGEGRTGQYLYLIDEAHNLVDRARSIYSASLKKGDVRHIKTVMKGVDRKLSGSFTTLINRMAELEDQLEASGEKYLLHDDISTVIYAAERVAGRMAELLSEREELPDETLDFYFDISRFVSICDRLDERYRIYSEKDGEGDHILQLFCVDPSGNLSEYFAMARSAVLFSATLLPVGYYMDLLAGNRDDYTIYADSVFDPKKLGVFIDTGVTSRYTRRSLGEYKKIADDIYNIITGHEGNYMVFFPSYTFLDQVYDVYTASYPEAAGGCLRQTPGMREDERAAFLENFGRKDGRMTGFCVLGGLFSEGIDLTGERLIGVIIIGTGLPGVSNERDILKRYFDENGRNGFDYAMKIPGMNKVLQAAGRVIRTEEDTGIVALLDDRFDRSDHRMMYPREWQNILKITEGNYNNLYDFWSRMG